MKLPDSLTKVTILSKVLAMILFVTLPMIGFYLGIKYQKEITTIPALNNRTTYSQNPPILKPTQSQINSINSSTRSNFAEIKFNSDKTVIVITSPDNKKVAKFYYKGPKQEYGDPTFSDVDILNKDTNEVTTYHLTGAITYMTGPLYWSPINNRIYFTHAGDDVGIYALWSSNVDGTEAQLISGNPDDPPYKDKNTLFNLAIYGAQCLDFSPDGKTIVTGRMNHASNYQSPLWLMSYDGTNSRPIQITGNYRLIDSIKWQSDGFHILFTVWNGTSGIPYLTDLNGTNPIELTFSAQ